MEQTDSLLYETGIIPVIRLEQAKQAVPLGRALAAGGICAAEITFRSSAAPKAIESMAAALPEMFVCAGTVLSVEQAKQAVSCGAKAIISPGTNTQVVSWCLENEVPVYPGCATPTEVEAALSLGLHTLKLFPAEVVGGIGMLKALFGPYQQVKFMPTGGIGTHNVVEYLLQPNVVACGGSWLCPKDLLEQENWGKITELAKDASKMVRKAREAKSLKTE